MTTIEEFATALKRDHGKIASLPIDGGHAFFRRPTAEEWDEAAAADADVKRRAHARMTRMCFVGALIDGAPHDAAAFETVVASCGPGWVGGPAGSLVNVLAGATERGAPRFF
jgi:hypothetical protein